MFSISSSEMRAWELVAEKTGISALTLMENAGRGIADFISAHFPNAYSVLFVCGKGNNAGDGFVAARFIRDLERRVEVLLLPDPGELRGAAKINFEKIKNLNIPVKKLTPEEDFRSYDLVVDAVFGIGMTRNASGIFLQAIQVMNASGKPVIAVDIPSGLHADTGEVLGDAVCALHTVTFGAMKDGLLKHRGPFYAGSVTVIEIGLPPRLEFFGE